MAYFTLVVSGTFKQKGKLSEMRYQIMGKGLRENDKVGCLRGKPNEATQEVIDYLNKRVPTFPIMYLSSILDQVTEEYGLELVSSCDAVQSDFDGIFNNHVATFLLKSKQ